VCFDAFCAWRLSLFRRALAERELAVVLRRWRLDARAEWWFYTTVLAVEELSSEITQDTYVQHIDEAGFETRKRVRPRWYWRERQAIREADPTYRERERLRSRLRRMRARDTTGA
jgi:hypothetical protein